MKLKQLFFILSAFIFSLAINAQTEKHSHDFDVEKHHKEQADFFTKGLELTDAEKEAFIPVMQDYIHARFFIDREVRNEAKALKSKGTKTEADYQKVIDLYLESSIKKAELQKEYYKKFGKILPAAKVAKYNRVEKQFMRRSVRHHHKEKEENED